MLCITILRAVKVCRLHRPGFRSTLFFFFFAHGPSCARLQTMLDKEAPLVPASACPAEREQSTPVWSAETMILPWDSALGTEPGLIPSAGALPQPLRPREPSDLVPRRAAASPSYPEAGCRQRMWVYITSTGGPCSMYLTLSWRAIMYIRLDCLSPRSLSGLQVLYPRPPPLLVPFLSIFFPPSLSAAGQKRKKKKKKNSHHFSLPLNLSGLMWVLI